MECPVCISPFNKTTRKPVSCYGCEFTACRECTKKYIVDNKLTGECMSCKATWGRRFMAEQFTKKFMRDDYTKHLKTLVADREMAMMADTQKYIESYRKSKLAMAKANELSVDIDLTRARIIQIKEELKDEEKFMRALRRDRGHYWMTAHAPLTKSTNEPMFRRCNTPNCTGYLDDMYACSVCHSLACEHCLEPMGTNPHTCDPNTVESIKLLEKETKPCPTCKAVIYKIDGCDQMWCTECKTAFSWVSGLRLRGIVHNPHYYEWMRQTQGYVPRQPGDNPHECGAPNVWSEASRIDNGEIPNDIRTYLHNVHTVLRYDIQWRLQFLPGDENAYEHDKLVIRLKYMNKDISQDDMVSQIQRMDRKLEYELEYRQIYDMIERACGDCLWRFFQIYATKGVCAELNVDELEHLRTMANTAFYDLSKTYGISMRVISNKWHSLY